MTCLTGIVVEKTRRTVPSRQPFRLSALFAAPSDFPLTLGTTHELLAEAEERLPSATAAKAASAMHTRRVDRRLTMDSQTH